MPVPPFPLPFSMLLSCRLHLVFSLSESNQVISVSRRSLARVALPLRVRRTRLASSRKPPFLPKAQRGGSRSTTGTAAPSG
jgi:hypothetical protein